MHLGNDKDKILMVVPDNLMIKSSTNLSIILSNPLNSHYKKVFCSFCRGQSGKNNKSIHAIERKSLISEFERKKIEQIVERIKFFKINPTEKNSLLGF
jgi:hypothetical protein